MSSQVLFYLNFFFLSLCVLGRECVRKSAVPPEVERALWCGCWDLKAGFWEEGYTPLSTEFSF